jgi:hypothetical protein
MVRRRVGIVPGGARRLFSSPSESGYAFEYAVKKVQIPARGADDTSAIRVECGAELLCLSKHVLYPWQLA